MRLLGWWKVVAIVWLGSLCGLAQISPDLEQGLRAYGSYHGGDLDHINLSNGDLFFHANLFSYSQRGGELAYPIVLQYNNENYTTFNLPCPSGTRLGTSGCPVYEVFGPPWNFQTKSLGNAVTIGFAGFPGLKGTSGGLGIDTGLSLNGQPIFVRTSTVATPDGSLHPLANTDSGTVTLDGSGFSGLTDGHGTKFSLGVAEDANGNQINSSSAIWTDTLGRQIPQAPGPDSPAATPSASTASLSACPALGYTNQPVMYAYIWNLPTTNGGTLALVLCYASVYVNTNSSATDTGGFRGIHQSFTMLQSVVFPDNTYWAFEYDAADPNNANSIALADLLKVTLPTGGSISYTWSPRSITGALSRSVMTRSVDANDGNGSQMWRYSYPGLTYPNSLPTQVTTVTDPMGNDTVHAMTGLGGFLALYETQVQYFQGSQSNGTLLKTVKTDYQYTLNPYDSGYITTGTLNNSESVTNVLPIRVTTTLPNGLVSKVETDYDTALAYHGPLDGIQSNDKVCSTDNTVSPPVMTCNYTNPTTWPVTNFTGSLGKVVAEREYDWGQGAPGALLRQTKTAYLWQSNSNYLSNNFLDLVSSVTVLDGASHQVAQTTYGYDEYGLQSSGISTQHNGSPVNGSVRGNQTSVHRWLSGSASSTPNCSTSVSNGSLVSYAQYNDTGTVYQSTDACGTAAGDKNHTTTHSYDFSSGAFPTQTCNPLGQCVSGSYDFNTGLLTSLTDANGKTSNYSYDNRWRMTAAVFPADASGNHPETDFSYPNATTVQRTKKLSGSQSIVDYAYFDGMGRTKQTRLVDPEGDDFVDTTYDPIGRVSTVSNPHRSTVGSTDGVTTNYYDALGRLVQAAGPDGTLVPAGTAVTQCQSNNLCTDYSSFPTVTVTDQAGKLRRSRSDALGRLVEVDEPGPGANSSGNPGSGSISISGSLYSSTSSGNKATGSVTVSGFVETMFISVCNDTCIRQRKTDPGGTVSITVNGHTNSVSYGGGSTANSLAGALIIQINGDSGAAVWASGPSCADSNDCTIGLQARTPGPNYSLSAQGLSNDEADGFTSFDGTSASAGSLSGGVYPVTTYDSGTVTVTVGGFQASAPYSQSGNSTAAQVAASLVSSTNPNGLNRSGSPVTASVSGTTISMTATGVGMATNYTVTGSLTQSFTASSTTLGGGTNPGGINAPYVTQYSYDPLGNLTQVNQQGDGSQAARVRNFTYDSLSHLLTATNPESGKISYSYDAGGNVLSKTSPAPNQTGTATQAIGYCYDTLNRVTGKGYGTTSTTCPLNSPVVTYTYDAGTNGIGHLTSLTDQAGSGSYSYDALGRITSEQRTINGVQKSLSYVYNLDNSISQLTYPSTAVLTYSYTNAGRVGAVQDTTNSISYVSGTGGMPTLATHTPDGSLSGYVNGYTGSFSGIGNSVQYNARLQVCRITALNGGTLPSSCTDNVHLGNVLDLGYNLNLGNGDNGNVAAITNYRDSSRNQSFAYDQLNRLTSAQNEGADCTQKTANNATKYWGNNYSYDAWGNLLGKSVTKCSAESLNVTALANNQLSGYGYDAAGNMTHDATTGNNYSFDAENRITGAANYIYTYDADGNRVAKSNGSTGTIYWYMSPGIVAESDLSGNLKSEYVFFDGERVARKDFPSNAVFYYFSDSLKTASVITDSAGTIKEDEDYYPWGGELKFIDNDSNHYKFGGHERDNETGLDYMLARYYSNPLGRFLTPDWAGKPITVPYANFGNPQSLNLYTYGKNNPRTFGDPDGHLGQDGQGFWDKYVVPTLQAINCFCTPTPTPPPQMQQAVGSAAAALGIGVSPQIQPNGSEPSTNSKADQLKVNQKQGNEFEKATKSNLQTKRTEVQEQVTIKTDSGVKTRVDFVSKGQSGQTALTEAKSSATAPLTPNQTKAFPEIQQTGGTVVGQGKPGFPGGTRIPPTEVEIVRPPILPE